MYRSAGFRTVFVIAALSLAALGAGPCGSTGGGGGGRIVADNANTNRGSNANANTVDPLAPLTRLCTGPWAGTWMGYVEAERTHVVEWNIACSDPSTTDDLYEWSNEYTHHGYLKVHAEIPAALPPSSSFVAPLGETTMEFWAESWDVTSGEYQFHEWFRRRSDDTVSCWEGSPAVSYSERTQRDDIDSPLLFSTLPAYPHALSLHVEIDPHCDSAGVAHPTASAELDFNLIYGPDFPHQVQYTDQGTSASCAGTNNRSWDNPSQSEATLGSDYSISEVVTCSVVEDEEGLIWLSCELPSETRPGAATDAGCCDGFYDPNCNHTAADDEPQGTETVKVTIALQATPLLPGQ